RFLSYPEPLGDLPVGEPLPDEIEHAQFRFRELGGGVRPALIAGESALIEQGPARGDRVDDVGDRRSPNCFQYERLRTYLLRGGDSVVVVERGEHDALGLGQTFAGLLDDVDPGAVGQLQVDEHHLGFDQVHTAHRFRDAARFGDDPQALRAVDDFGDTAADDLVVVNDHYFDVSHGVQSSGLLRGRR